MLRSCLCVKDEDAEKHLCVKDEDAEKLSVC